MGTANEEQQEGSGESSHGSCMTWRTDWFHYGAYERGVSLDEMMVTSSATATHAER